MLVTNAISFLPQVDTVVVLKDGRVTEAGSYQQLLENNGAFAEFVTQYLVEQEDTDDDERMLLYIP